MEQSESWNLDRLKELTHAIQGQVPVQIGIADVLEYDAEKGTCIGVAFYTANDFAITKLFFSKDTVLQNQCHNVEETYIVCSGEIVCEVEDNTYHLRRGEVHKMPVDREYHVTALEDTWVVSVRLVTKYV